MGDVVIVESAGEVLLNTAPMHGHRPPKDAAAGGSERSEHASPVIRTRFASHETIAFKPVDEIG